MCPQSMKEKLRGSKRKKPPHPQRKPCRLFGKKAGENPQARDKTRAGGRREGAQIPVSLGPHLKTAGELRKERKKTQRAAEGNHRNPQKQGGGAGVGGVVCLAPSQRPAGGGGGAPVVAGGGGGSFREKRPSRGGGGGAREGGRGGRGGGRLSKLSPALPETP